MSRDNYLNELELKSLIIRVKNGRLAGQCAQLGQHKSVVDDSVHSRRMNARIQKYIRWYISISNLKKSERINLIMSRMKQRIISLSEQTVIDTVCYERFGGAVMILIHRIMGQKKFSGYSYRDEFISSSVVKILQYIVNFDHRRVSKITGQTVSAFSYLTQIITNSIIFTINKAKRDRDFIHDEINQRRVDFNLPVADFNYTVTRDVHTYSDITTIPDVMDILKKEKRFIKNNKVVIQHNMDDLEDLHELHNIQCKYKNLELIHGCR